MGKERLNKALFFLWRERASSLEALLSANAMHDDLVSKSA
ncbi:hypothetical protein AtDm6_3303 [Acetobacter tropicalis]|uniref:Uncharacterized protein n=1 Tax=Acetobacter tropicalis TaxID=104102 RepID=A0A095AVY6_9PROT|nr:hypothetical protein AtDm6_3303 [Acetobacter tropicalis]